MFEKRSGTTCKGRLYEDLNVANLILKLLTDKKDASFYASSNHKEFASFDDIVLEIKLCNKTSQMLALQLKYQNKCRKLTKDALTAETGDFSIFKFFKDFIGYFNDPQDFRYKSNLILFTNLEFDIPDGEIIELKNSLHKVKIRRIAITNDDLVNNSCKNDRYYTFEFIGNGKINNNSLEANNYRSFFKRFFLYANQENTDALEGKIKKKFQTIFGCDKNKSEQYLQFVFKWSIQEGKKDKLSTVIMTHAIAIILLSPFVTQLSFIGGSLNNNFQLLRNAILKFNIILLDEESNIKIKEIWFDLEHKLQNLKQVNQIGKTYQLLDKPVQNIDELTNQQKTLLLWLMSECPLIISSSDVMYNIINLCPQDRFILLGKNILTTKIGSKSVLRNLIDLKMKCNTTDYDEILKNFKCSLQGKEKISLQTLVYQCQDLLKFITINDLIKMANDSYTLGGEEILPAPYIDRFVSNNVIDFKFLKHISIKINLEDIIVINCMGKFKIIKDYINNFNVIKIDEYLKRNKNISTSGYKPPLIRRFMEKDIYISENECNQYEFNEMCRRNPAKNCHHLKINEDGKLEWIQSKGDISDLLEYRYHSNYIEESNFCKSKIKDGNMINIICNDPGMGKSVFMKHLKNHYLPTYWVIFIRTKEHLTYFNNTSVSANNFIDYIINKTCKECAEFVKILNDYHRVMYIWDGLDEICIEDSSDCLKIIINVIQDLSTKNLKHWISSRYDLRNILEKHFCVLSREIKDFSTKDQELYIQQRLSHSVTDVLDIITNIANCLSVVKYNDILGIPLQIFMLTELFLKDQQKYNVLTKKIFSLANLYQDFIEMNFEIYFKQKLELSRKWFLNEFKKNRIKKYQKIALRFHFDQEILDELKVDLTDLLDDTEEQVYNDGIVVQMTADRKQFIHNSYGEYLAATYLYQKCKKNLQLKNVIFKECYRNIRFFFDLLLANQSEPHKALLYKNFNNYQAKCTDEGGRNLLHLACSWGSVYPLLCTKQEEDTYIIDETMADTVKNDSEAYKSIFGDLIKINDPNETDELLNLNSIHYADQSLCLYPIISLLMNKYKINLKELKNFKDVCSVLYYCARFNYPIILDIIETLPYILTKEDNKTLLHLAAIHNSKEFLEKILLYPNERKPLALDVNNKDKIGKTPLHDACLAGHYKIVELLIESKSDVNAISAECYTPLHNACFNGHYDIVELLINSNAKVNILSGYSPLHDACFNGHYHIVNLLIESGAKVNAVNESGVTALHHVSSRGHYKIAELLIEKHAIVNASSENGFTPLHNACTKGHDEIVKLLIAKGAKVNAVNQIGVTSLHFVSSRGYYKIAKLLIDSNQANVNIISVNGLTPLHNACSRGHCQIVELLIKSGADVNAIDEKGTTPLHNACNREHYDVVELLMKEGADVKAANKKGVTSLHYACSRGHYKIVELLIKSGADVNAVSNNKCTPLHNACSKGNCQIVDLLIKSNADVNAVNDYGTTPLYNTQDNEIRDLLIKASAEVQCELEYYVDIGNN